MGKFAPNHFADRACDEIPRLFDSSAGLCRDAGVELVSAVDHTNYRDAQSSAATAAERQRSALESLIATLVPADAARISATLINEFNSLSRIFGESKEGLERVIGRNSQVIELLRSAQIALIESLYSEVQLRLISTTDQRLIDYLVASMASQPVERLRILFLDRGNHLIGDEIMATGSLTTMTVYPRTIFKRAFEHSASAIMLVHNHPGGSVEPSRCDIDFTRKLAALGKALEIDLLDHIIIAGAKWSSFMRWGLL